jgi:argininosuccinate lyase
MLAQQKIISKNEAAKIVSALKNILKDIEKGKITFSPADEDIHMAIEKELISRIGDVGGKLHSARSRNDQIVLDVRLFLRTEIKSILILVNDLQVQLIKLAKSEIKTIMPGYTHMQKAQPVLLSHYFLAFGEMFARDAQRLNDCKNRLNVLPLGAAALAGTSLPIDRQRTAKILNFPAVSKNSMDTVADRDFIAEFIFASSLIMMHLSRFCEDLVMWSSDEFGFVEISDAYTTGSSIMPQKKNPDVLELVRSRAARVTACQIAVLDIVRSSPSGYNRDLQDAKEPFMEGLATTRATLRILAPLIAGMEINADALVTAFTSDVFATDHVLELVAGGMPFRDAYHHVKAHLDELENMDPFTAIGKKTHLGAPAGLDFDTTTARIVAIAELVTAERAEFNGAISKLLGVRWPLAK